MTNAATISTSVLPEWRVQVSGLIQHAREVMRETEERLELQTGNGPYAFQLLYEAERLFDRNSDLLRTALADDYYGDVLLPAQAMIMGARDMSDTHRALSVMLEPAVAALAKAAEILDVAEVAHG